MNSLPRKKLLLIAYHFPPIQGSTGASRTIAFSKYLRQDGWDVRILTINPKAYEDTAIENQLLVPPYVCVDRAWGFDSRRRLAVMGRYPLFLALPDRWQSWIAGGFIRGLKIVRTWHPDVIMTTYPIPSAHFIGFLLQRRFKLPWVAEFRDPMLQPDYPTRRWERRAFAKIEQLVFTNANKVVVTTDGCMTMYLNRFPDLSRGKISCIPNGYDPEMFAETAVSKHRASGTLVLLHSGLLYPGERNPATFFQAVRSLAASGFLDNHRVEFRLRATGNDENYKNMVRSYGIDSYVSILPRVPYVKALEEMKAADALLLFQADNCNAQIPAKVYEYMYCRKPILAFADPAGETGTLLRSVGVHSIAKLEEPRQIEDKLKDFLEQMRTGEAFVVAEDDVARFSRQSRSSELNRVLMQSIEENSIGNAEQHG